MIILYVYYILYKNLCSWLSISITAHNGGNNIIILSSRLLMEGIHRQNTASSSHLTVNTAITTKIPYRTLLACFGKPACVELTESDSFYSGQHSLLQDYELNISEPWCGWSIEETLPLLTFHRPLCDANGFYPMMIINVVNYQDSYFSFVGLPAEL